MQSCYVLKPVAAPMLAPLTEIAEPVLQNQHFQIPNSYSTTVNEQYIPFCAEVTIRTTEGPQRPVTLLRNTGAMQSLVSRKPFQPFEYVDTNENRLIKEVLDQAVAVLLVEISARSDQGDGTILCDLIDELPQEVDILVGNGDMDLFPVHVGVITRSPTRKTNTENAVRTPNTEEDVVSEQGATRQMTNDVVNQLETIAQDPSIALLSINDDVNLDLDQELPIIFDVQLSLDVVAGQSIVSRDKLIALQRKDKSLARYFDLVQSPDANDENSFVLRNEVLVSFSGQT